MLVQGWWDRWENVGGGKGRGNVGQKHCVNVCFPNVDKTLASNIAQTLGATNVARNISANVAPTIGSTS